MRTSTPVVGATIASTTGVDVLSLSGDVLSLSGRVGYIHRRHRPHDGSDIRDKCGTG